MTLEVVLIIVVMILVGVVFFLLSRKNITSDSGSLKLLQEQLLHLNKTIDYKLGESNRNMSRNFETSTKINTDATNKIEEITKKLTSLEETNKQIKDIGGQLEGLESILKNPKQRGILGEYFLENVLKNILPPNNYELQYQFQNGEVVDAVIFVKETIIAIDSKFSLENYNRILESTSKEEKEKLEKEFRNDLKKRIDETAKYIRPSEKTMEFAFMFIPSEGIYYDLLINKIGVADLIEYAFKEKRVIIVSPTSFYAYLQTVMQGLRALQIEEKAKDIAKHVEKLAKHLSAYEEYLQRLGKTLGTSINQYNETYKKFHLIDKDVVKITGGAAGGDVEELYLDKPDI